jgi:hypothetical protein
MPTSAPQVFAADSAGCVHLFKCEMRHGTLHSMLHAHSLQLGPQRASGLRGTLHLLHFSAAARGPLLLVAYEGLGVDLIKVTEVRARGVSQVGVSQVGTRGEGSG